MDSTLFDLPTQPEEFGVVLEPASLRRINFSALEYPELRRALIEYIQTYFPDQFNDFVANNGIIMLLELVAYVGDVMTQRMDILVDESFLPTAQSVTAVDQHLQLINDSIQRATPAVVDIEVSLTAPVPVPVRVPAGTTFNLLGSDGAPLTYELYRAPDNFDDEIVIFPGQRGTIGFGIEGAFAAPFVVESTGGPDQRIDILDENVLDEPIIVESTVGNETVRWRRISNIERSDANDRVFEVRFLEESLQIRFGNDVTGRSPLSGETLTVRYRVGGGIRGRIASNVINESRPVNPDDPVSAPVQVLFRNPAPSNGGRDTETIDQAKVRAPRESATLESAVSGENYSVLAQSFNHPIFGSVLKAVATVRTSLNANIVEVYVLAAGPDNIPVLPSAGLKQGLETFFADIDVLTDETRILNGAIKPIDVEATVVISRNFDPALIRTQVDNTIVEFFDQSNFDLGTEFYLGRLYAALQDIDGVQFVKIFNPTDDIIASSKIASETPSNQVGFNELLTLGQVNVKIFFER